MSKNNDYVTNGSGVFSTMKIEKTAKDLAFDRERDRFRKALNSIESKVDNKDKEIFDLRTEINKLNAEKEDIKLKYELLLVRSELSEADIQEHFKLLKNAALACEMAKLFNIVGGSEGDYKRWL